MVSLRRQRRAAGGGVTTGVHGGIGHALEELVDRDAPLLDLDAADLEVEIVEIRHTAGAVDGQIGLEAPLHALLDAAYEQPLPDGIDLLHVDAELDLDPQLACAPHEHVDQVGIESFERTRPAMEDR